MGKINVIVYTTETVLITGSPKIPEQEFNKTAIRIAEIAQRSTTKLSKLRPITFQRAEGIINFALNLNPDSEYERMVIIILADTSNEIVLTELMKSLGIKGESLKEGIPKKIEKLREKKSDSIYGR